MEQIQIQVQDLTGNWRTFGVTQNQSNLILMEMQNLQRKFPKQRIRAVDMSGRIVDIL